MNYVEKVSLNPTEVAQAKELTQKVHAADGTYEDIYLSNRYNYFAEMPTFVLAYEASKLVGLTMLYADDEPDEVVDVHLEVAPDFRRRGIAKEMLVRAEKILGGYGYHNYNYVSEKNFLEQNSDFLLKTGLVIKDRTYNMRTKSPLRVGPTDQLDQTLAVNELKQADVAEVAKFHSKAFGDNLTSSTKYIEEGLQNEETSSFVLLYQNKIVGYCAVELGSYDYFFGLFIASAVRNRGFATFFVKKMTQLLQQKGSKEFVLDVETDNTAAIHAYQNAGFKINGETDYLEQKAGKSSGLK
ncbi:GNAT family N-acetyltransferase [Lactobacillus xylocopicola]|uniref:N-acetyltransferase n=1 Tax=Lactobacillus xylocopicola TaxID=2976676 RepID=A0ABN6SKI2_9LACO|nr:GNAT family N-acetyltransferase [Lactobacillus xylocopicola]BDR60694.1 N-acetyltransferase [Lactobacillus xylocopicola]